MSDSNLIDSDKLASAAQTERGVVFDLSKIMPDVPVEEDLEGSRTSPRLFPDTLDTSSLRSLQTRMTDLWNGIVFKLVVQAGTGRSTPGDHFITKIKYEAYLEDSSQPYDAQVKRLRLDSNSIVIGLEVGLKSMVFDEVSLLLLHPEAAYGSAGLYPVVPPDSLILFRVEMLNFSAATPADHYYEHSFEIRRSMAFEDVQSIILGEKEEGNKCFSYKKFNSAIGFYQRALRVLEERHCRDTFEEIHLRRLRLEVTCNIALCRLRLGDFEDCDQLCRSCLREDPTCVKALYRLSKALCGMGKRDKAMKYLKKAFEVEPNNSQIGRDLIAMEKEAMITREEEWELFRRAFGREKVEKEEPVEETFKESALDVLGQLVEDGDCDEVVFDDLFSPSERYYVYMRAKEMGLRTERVGESILVFKS